MVVDIGGGTTEVAILSLYGVVRLRSFQIGGDEFDRAIAHRLGADRFHVGPLTAESLKIDLGFAGRAPGRAPMVASGLDLSGRCAALARDHRGRRRRGDARRHRDASSAR